MIDHLVLLLLSSIFGYFGACCIARFGYKLNLIDKPGERSSHDVNTPKGGGIGILISFLVICADQDISWRIYIPILILSLISLLGDRIDISPKIRLFIQFFVAAIVLIEVTNVQANFMTSESLFIQKSCQIILFTALVIFIVGTANFYNFMDGINGIAGMTGVISFGFLGYVAHLKGGSDSKLLALGIALACLGFLPWNIPKAKVFMGDVGSILLGFIFAVLVIRLSDNFVDFLCYAGFILPFYADELITMFGRIKDCEDLTQAHRRHLYQVLANEREIDHWKVSLLYGFLQIIICIVLIWARMSGLLSVFTVLVGAFAFFTIMNLTIKKRTK